MHLYIRKICTAFFYQFQADICREFGGIRRQDKDMQQVTHSSRSLYQIPVTVGKRIGIHDNGANPFTFFGRGKSSFSGYIFPDSIPAVLHKQHILCLSNRVKSHVGKHLQIHGFCEQKQVGKTLCSSIFYKLGHEEREAAFPLKFRINGNTF